MGCRWILAVTRGNEGVLLIVMQFVSGIQVDSGCTKVYVTRGYWG